MVDKVVIQEPLGSSDHNQLNFNINMKSDKTKVKQCRRDFRKGNYSAVAHAWHLAMFGYNRFFAFFNSSLGTDEILPGWELASGLAFSESNMAAKEGNRIMIIDISS